MTVGKAREILDKKAKNLTDAQILKIITMLTLICSKAIDQATLKENSK